MFVPDGHLPLGPALADRGHRRREQLLVDVGWRRPTGKQLLGDCPRSVFVSVEEALREPVDGSGGGPVTSGGDGVSPAIEAAEFGLTHHPLGPFTLRRHSAGSHVPVDRHVADAESLGHVGQAQAVARGQGVLRSGSANPALRWQNIQRRSRRSGVSLRRVRFWRERLDARADEARSLGFDDRFLRMWRFYFAYCAAGFAERHVSVVQLVLARRGWRGPLRPRSL